jgi:glucose-1-phosphate cytidylyltransferase
VVHCVDIGQGNKISRIQSARDLSVWVNGGYFALRQEVFDHLPEGGDLVADACTALAKQDRLLAYPYSGFWQSADTIKERNELEAAYQAGTRPWMVWEREADRSPLAGLVAQNLAG